MSERDDLVESLNRQRYFLLSAIDGVSDADAARAASVSELCLGGLVKHVGKAEAQWAAFVVEGASAMGAGNDPAAMQDWMSAFTMTDGETVADVVAGYREVAAATDDLVRSVPDLDARQPLPKAPWFEPGASWSARRVFLHIVGEISQHAGHADIVRESIDGKKSMG